MPAGSHAGRLHGVAVGLCGSVFLCVSCRAVVCRGHAPLPPRNRAVLSPPGAVALVVSSPEWFVMQPQSKSFQIMLLLCMCRMHGLFTQLAAQAALRVHPAGGHAAWLHQHLERGHGDVANRECNGRHEHRQEADVLHHAEVLVPLLGAWRCKQPRT